MVKRGSKQAATTRVRTEPACGGGALSDDKENETARNPAKAHPQSAITTKSKAGGGAIPEALHEARSARDGHVRFVNAS
eukprot:1570437-Prymnesium_polylepis.2